jgi:hypothetical protein
MSFDDTLEKLTVKDHFRIFERSLSRVKSNPPTIGSSGPSAHRLIGPSAHHWPEPRPDAIATYLALGVRAPISPLSSHIHSVKRGRRLFETAGCQNCHGGADWTSSIIDFTPPPAATEIVDAQLVRFLCRVGTFDPALFTDGVSNEIRANNVANVQARGVLGINVPSLISVFASAPYLHSGAALTLDAVLQNVTHRSAGTGGVDTLTNASDRRAVVRFLHSIDRDTEPFPVGTSPANSCGAMAMARQ